MSITTAVVPEVRASVTLEASGLYKHFYGVIALENLSLTLERGQVTSIIGPNGAGKSTLLNVITGFIPPDRGAVLYRGQDITGLCPRDRVRLGICRSFQEVRLFERLTVLENVLVAFPDRIGEKLLPALFWLPAVAREDRALREAGMAFLEYVGLAEFAHKWARDLSYGQQKLLALARLLATGADVILLDEPASGLDAQKIEQLHQLLRDLASRGKTVCLVEHNIEMVVEISSKVIVLHQGQKIAEGPPTEVMRHKHVLSAYLGE